VVSGARIQQHQVARMHSWPVTSQA
jgi:hypothetical protein